MNVYIGTCGFAYPDWEARFYPPSLPVSDRLSYYADRFRAVELNSLFYHLPSADSIAKMLKRTRKEFVFTVKAHRSITHEFDLSAAEFGGFLKAVAPIRSAGRLGAVLVQFPPAFQCTRDSVQTLRAIRDELAELPLTVEFRHASWNRPETFEFLRKHGMAYCVVDEPTAEGGMPPVVERTAEYAYIRLHGRNTPAWLHARSASERHNYLYSPEELDEWAERIRHLAEEGSRVYVMLSNVHEAKAIANARDLAERLGLPQGVPIRLQQAAEQTELALS